MNSRLFREDSFRRIERLESRIESLLPQVPSLGRPRPELLDALDAYGKIVVEAAGALPAPEDAHELARTARALAPHPVFVVGVHRSGTTLIQQLLDGHPELAVLPAEGTYLTSIYPKIRALDGPERISRLLELWLPRLSNPINRPPYWTLGRTRGTNAPYLNVARNALHLSKRERSLLDTYAPFQPFLALVLAVHWERRRLAGSPNTPVRYWVDKTPLNEFHVDRLRRVFPQARFIHIVRDPRAILASRQRLNTAVFGRPGNLFRLALQIRRSFAKAIRNQARFGREAYHIVRYEDLVQAPSERINAVRLFLGIGEDEALERPTSAGVPASANSSYDVPSPAGTIGNFSVAHFAGVLTPNELGLIQGVAGSSASVMGYAPDSNPTGIRMINVIRYFAKRGWGC